MYCFVILFVPFCYFLVTVLSIVAVGVVVCFCGSFMRLTICFAGGCFGHLLCIVVIIGEFFTLVYHFILYVVLCMVLLQLCRCCIRFIIVCNIVLLIV